MTPIEWLATDQTLLEQFGNNGLPFSPSRAYAALVQEGRYESLGSALSTSDQAQRDDLLSGIRDWLLRQPVYGDKPPALELPSFVADSAA